MAKQTKPRVTREDIDARLRAAQERNRARRAHKVTGEDLRRRFDVRAAARSSAGSLGRGARAASIAAGCAMLVGVLVAGTATTSGTTRSEADLARVEQQIATKQGELDAIPAASKKAASKYTSTLRDNLAAASKKGDAVAALQQQFAVLAANANATQEDNGGASAAFLALVQHRKDLAPYFVERSLIADNAEAYAPGSVLPFDADQIDPRFPWYLDYTDDTKTSVAAPSTSTWKLASMIATETPGVFEATWLNRNATGELYAWATASYYVDGGQFGSLRVGTTTIGTGSATAIQTAGK